MLLYDNIRVQISKHLRPKKISQGMCNICLTQQTVIYSNSAFESPLLSVRYLDKTKFSLCLPSYFCWTVKLHFLIH